MVRVGHLFERCAIGQRVEQQRAAVAHHDRRLVGSDCDVRQDWLAVDHHGLEAARVFAEMVLDCSQGFGQKGGGVLVARE